MDGPYLVLIGYDYKDIHVIASVLPTWYHIRQPSEQTVNESITIAI